jgi:hypothetical protein
LRGLTINYIDNFAWQKIAGGTFFFTVVTINRLSILTAETAHMLAV